MVQWIPGIHVNSCHDIVRNSFYVTIMISHERKGNRVHDQSESFSTGFTWEIHELLKKDRQWIDIALMGLCGLVVEDDETHEILIGLVIPDNTQWAKKAFNGQRSTPRESHWLPPFLGFRKWPGPVVVQVEMSHGRGISCDFNGSRKKIKFETLFYKIFILY